MENYENYKKIISKFLLPKIIGQHIIFYHEDGKLYKIICLKSFEVIEDNVFLSGIIFTYNTYTSYINGLIELYDPLKREMKNVFFDSSSNSLVYLQMIAHDILSPKINEILSTKKAKKYIRNPTPELEFKLVTAKRHPNTNLMGLALTKKNCLITKLF